MITKSALCAAALSLFLSPAFCGDRDNNNAGRPIGSNTCVAGQACCQISPFDYAPCIGSTDGLVSCGTDEAPRYCLPSGQPAGGGDDRNFFQSPTGKIVISIAVGVAFVGAMWYIFRTPPSSNFDGHVRLATF